MFQFNDPRDNASQAALYALLSVDGSETPKSNPFTITKREKMTAECHRAQFTGDLC